MTHTTDTSQSSNKPPLGLHAPTPLLYSTSMSKQAGYNVWLKLENMQPTHSFKIRGIGSLCAKAHTEQGAKHYVAIGDTNTALAVAYSGRQLGIPVTVFVPSSGQAPPIRPKIELEGATVIEDGRTLKEAYGAARAFARKTDGAFVVDTANDGSIVSGHSTIVAEISVQLQRREPAAIITSVGSGALLAGLIAGLRRCSWQRVPIIAVETHNTNSFQRALLLEPEKQHVSAAPGVEVAPALIPPLEGGPESDCDSPSQSAPLQSSQPQTQAQTLPRGPEPTVATCLLSGSICPSALRLARAHAVVPLSVTEAMSVEACRRFLDDHHLLVEIGCAAALSVVAKGLVHQIVPALGPESHVVVVVTGGANISLDRLESCRQRFPYPAPIIAKSGHEIFMRMLDSSQPSTANGSGPSNITPTPLHDNSSALASDLPRSTAASTPSIAASSRP
ncbi:catabolic L-serine/threonine dehydratase [Coemansia sp. RSA 988]|nr:catabolic L-serine/threonine dehydratase [Coemansia sp. RSA 988]